MMSHTPDHDPETGEIREAAAANLAEFSVSEISHALKRSIEDRFGHVRVRGEISGYKGPHSSGHCYFSLKDEGAKLDAVIWRGSFGSSGQNCRKALRSSSLANSPPIRASHPIRSSLKPWSLLVLARSWRCLRSAAGRLAAEGLFDARANGRYPICRRVLASSPRRRVRSFAIFSIALVTAFRATSSSGQCVFKVKPLQPRLWRRCAASMPWT
jgi:hypothetical protein